MQNYEGLRQKDVTYDEIKTTEEKTEINHVVVKPMKQGLKHFLLILLISVFSADVASAITYLTVCGKSEIKGISIHMLALYICIYNRNIYSNKISCV